MFGLGGGGERLLRRGAGGTGVHGVGGVASLQPGPDDVLVRVAATALNRYGHVEEIAAMVAFVAGPESSYVTGANLTVDGGMNA